MCTGVHCFYTLLAWLIAVVNVLVPAKSTQLHERTKWAICERYIGVAGSGKNGFHASSRSFVAADTSICPSV